MAASKGLNLARGDDLTARFEQIDPAGDVVVDKNGEPGWIELLSPDAPEVQDMQRRFAAKRKVAEANRRPSHRLTLDDGMKLSDEEMEFAVELHAKRTKAWRLIGTDGEEQDYPCTFENAKALYGEPAYAYLFSALMLWASDRGNFFRKNASS